MEANLGKWTGQMGRRDVVASFGVALGMIER